MTRLLVITGGADSAPQVSLDRETHGIPLWHLQHANVCGEVPADTIPLMMGSKLGIEATAEVIRLADVKRLKLSTRELPAEDVHAGDFSELSPERI